MSTLDIVRAASAPAFYTRVAFISLRVAQNVATEDINTPNHINRMKYAARVFTGDDKSLALALHVAAANPVISGALENGDVVSDNDIEFVLASIWDARANAFAQGV